METEKRYSPLMDGLRQTFETYAKGGSRYLLAYWQGWGERTDFVATRPGEWPWAAHDAYMANDNNASILAIAFDLAKSFDEQVPEHMRGFETLESFGYKPLINIPDRTGQIPSVREQEAIEQMLRPAPVLRLIK